MHFQLLFSGLGNGLSGTGFFLVVAALACVLGAEIACVCVLISKMLRARKQKKSMEEDDRHRSYGGGTDGFVRGGAGAAGGDLPCVRL